jgi:hypothetical protein
MQIARTLKLVKHRNVFNPAYCDSELPETRPSYVSYLLGPLGVPFSGILFNSFFTWAGITQLLGCSLAASS